MRYPAFLKEKGTIGFVAPSFGCNINPYKAAFLNAQKKFAELGYGIDLGPNCYKGEGIGISNTPEKCARELEEYYVRSENDCLISCGGGELMCEILPHMDFQKIKDADPKWYVGYSDNTNMTYLLTTLCDTAAIYGPCAAAFGMEPWHQAIGDTFSLVTGDKLQVESYGLYEKESLKDEEHPLEPYHCTEPLQIKIFAPTEDGTVKECENAKVEGRLIGGCMDCLVNILGTRFDGTKAFLEKYKEDGFIWFLEACDLNVFSIRRAMWQMENAGWFQYVKGFLIGRPILSEEMFGLNHFDAVLSTAQKYGVPVLMDVDLGHIPPMMPLISGSMASVEGADGKVKIQMQLR